MIRAVLDTNVLVSGFGWSGAPAQIVQHALRGSFLAVTSSALLAELGRTLSYPKLSAVFGDPEGLVRLVAESFEVVAPQAELAVLADEPDNRLLEAAVGYADFIVTGDAALLSLGNYEQVRIIASRDFLDVLL